MRYYAVMRQGKRGAAELVDRRVNRAAARKLASRWNQRDVLHLYWVEREAPPQRRKAKRSAAQTS